MDFDDYFVIGSVFLSNQLTVVARWAFFLAEEADADAVKCHTGHISFESTRTDHFIAGVGSHGWHAAA